MVVRVEYHPASEREAVEGMSGVSVTVARIAAPFGGPAAGLLSGCALAAMAAADEMAKGGAFFWQNGLYDSTSLTGPGREYTNDEVQDVLNQVELQIPRPNSPEAVAELNCLLNHNTIASLLVAYHSVPAVVSEVTRRATQIVEAAEERAQERAEMARSSSRRTKAVRFEIEERKGALHAGELTDDDRKLIEARLRELRDLRDKTMDELHERFAYEDGAWKITLGDAKRFVFIPHKSIRMSDVKEVIVDGKRFYDVVLLGLPSVAGGKLVFEDSITQRFGEDSDLIKKNGKDTDSLASTLMKMDSKAMMDYIAAEQQRLKERLETSQEKPAPSAISGGESVSAADLCTLSPNSAALSLLPQYKKVAAAPALTH